MNFVEKIEIVVTPSDLYTMLFDYAIKMNAVEDKYKIPHPMQYAVKEKDITVDDFGNITFSYSLRREF